MLTEDSPIAKVAGNEGQTVMEVAEENGIDIPGLCHLPGIHDRGACRLPRNCLVRRAALVVEFLAETGRAVARVAAGGGHCAFLRAYPSGPRSQPSRSAPRRFSRSSVVTAVSNPASATAQLIGVYEPKLTEMFAGALKNLGTKRAFIVHGADGLDEATVTGQTRVSELKEGIVTTYNIDPVHATAQFKVRHLMVANVRGHLGEVTGEVRFDPTDPSRSSVNASIDAAGIDTRNPDRDTHLRSPDFLDVAHHPAITFRSTAVRAEGAGEYRVDGELTIRSTTRPVTLKVEVSEEIRDPWGNVKRGIEASARIDRKDWGLTWNAVMEGGGILVGDTVDIAIEAELAHEFIRGGISTFRYLDYYSALGITRGCLGGMQRAGADRYQGDR